MNTNSQSSKYTLKRKVTNGNINWEYRSKDFGVYISGNTGYFCTYNNNGIEISTRPIPSDNINFYTNFFNKLYENELQQIALAGKYYEVTGRNLDSDMREFNAEMQKFNQDIEKEMRRFEADLENIFNEPLLTTRTSNQFHSNNQAPHSYTIHRAKVRKNHGCIVSLLILLFWLFVIGVSIRIVLFLLGMIFSVPALGWEFGEQIVQFLKNLF